jgi:hypothetical protein
MKFDLRHISCIRMTIRGSHSHVCIAVCKFNLLQFGVNANSLTRISFEPLDRFLCKSIQDNSLRILLSVYLIRLKFAYYIYICIKFKKFRLLSKFQDF